MQTHVHVRNRIQIKPLNTTIAAVECGRKTFDCVVVQKSSQQFEIRAARRNVPCLFIPMAGQQLLLQIFHLCLDTSHLMFLAEPIQLETLVVQLGKGALTETNICSYIHNSTVILSYEQDRTSDF